MKEMLQWSKDELDKHFKQKKRDPYMEYSNTLVRATKMRNIMRQSGIMIID